VFLKLVFNETISILHFV